jgi:hypothetical protein
VAAGLIWYISSRWLILPGTPKALELAGHVAPHADALPPNVFERMNTKRAALMLPPALDGIAVVYCEKVAGLVADDGKFRTNLSARALASVLGVEPQAFGRKNAPSEVDPDVVLFTAVTGQLNAKAKALARQTRSHEQSEGRFVSASVDDWHKTLYPFTLRAIEIPTSEQRALLDAISLSARGIASIPGARINAVALFVAGPNVSLKEAVFAPGYLPLESPPAD